MKRRVALINNTCLLTSNIVSKIRENAVGLDLIDGTFAVSCGNTDSNDPCFGDLLSDEMMWRQFPFDSRICPAGLESLPEVRSYDVVRNSGKIIGWICICLRVGDYYDNCPDDILNDLLDGLDAAIKEIVPCAILSER